jgi:hypothetical protein
VPDTATSAIFTTVILKYEIRMPIKTLQGRATGIFILDEDYKIKEYWLHEWNQQMINWVFRSSRWFGWTMKLVPRKKKKK